MTPFEAGVSIHASSTYCAQCPFGQFQVLTGKTTCAKCARGRYGNTGILQNTARHCVACDEGTYSANPGAQACKKCHNWSPTCVYCKWTARRTGALQCVDKPVPCEVSTWSEWGACSKSCAGGKQERKRTVVRQRKFGGAKCPVLTQSRSCNVQNCPVNCLVTKWDSFSRCSEVCAGGSAPNGGTKTRKRAIHRHPKFGCAACPPLTETTPCNTQTCGLCSHVKCHAVSRVRMGGHDGHGVCLTGHFRCRGANIKPRLHIEVLYHNKEARGDQHKCQWNKSSKQCECLCAQSGPSTAQSHAHWGAAKSEVSAFFAAMKDSELKAAMAKEGLGSTGVYQDLGSGAKLISTPTAGSL